MIGLDLKLEYNETTGFCDLVFEENDLKAENGLETALMISLFTDRRATNDEREIGEQRGWFGDLLGETEGDQIGSKIWLLGRAKFTTETNSFLNKYATDACQWMIDDGLVKDVSVEVERYDFETLAFKCAVTKNDGEKIPFKFSQYWENM